MRIAETGSGDCESQGAIVAELEVLVLGAQWVRFSPLGWKKWCALYRVSDQNPLTGGSWPAAKVTVSVLAPLSRLVVGDRLAEHVEAWLDEWDTRVGG